jgi:hypothetical protein
VDTTQTEMLPVEAMGKRRLSRVAQTRRNCAGSLEHQQIRARAVAAIENTGVESGAAGENVQQHGAAIFMRCTLNSGRIVDHRNAGYVVRMSGVVGGRGREVSSYPD